jgi:hypothetical protein
MKEWTIFACFLLLLIFGIKSCTETEWYKESERADEAQRKADAMPHVIREADGCKVYAFRGGDTWHYFTRCATTTTTERHYTQSCGKKCTKQMTEEITTENR